MTRISRSVSALIVIGYVAGASVYPAIPRPYCGPECDISIGRLLIAFLLPTATLLLPLLLNALWTRDPVRDRNEEAERMYQGIVLRVELLILGIHIAVLTAFATALQSDVIQVLARLVPMMFGIAVVSIGNVMPRLRPNLVIGIRTRNTLSDRAVWMATHRIAGYIAVACGLAIAAAPLSLALPVGSRMILIVGPFALLSIPALIVYSNRKARA
jgi:uncharacterized membrane protein